MSGQQEQPGTRHDQLIPPEVQAIMLRSLAQNGLAWRRYDCERCKYHIVDEAVLMGCLRKRCPRCKWPQEREFNRIGEEAIMEYAVHSRRARIALDVATGGDDGS